MINYFFTLVGRPNRLSFSRRFVNTNSGSDPTDRKVTARITLEDGSVFEGIFP